MKARILIGVAAALFIFNSALAADITCRGGVVHTGDSKSAVLGKCGKPAHVYTSGEKTPSGLTMEQWRYSNRGGTFRDFWFEGDMLKTVKDKVHLE